ncbi:MAG TPA: hypothetical protein VIW29_15415 [Polyangiaceae bacterium]
MAVVGYGALACSDPVPLPAQGAINTQVSAVSPPVQGKACSAGASFTYDVPQVREDHPDDVLDDGTYIYKVIDGDNNATVKCSVKGGPVFNFSGNIVLNGEGMEVTGGTVDATLKGTATITIKNSQHLSSSLISPPSSCAIDIVTTNAGPQVKAGSMWAHFSCPAVEAPPSDSCAAQGYFVFENCAQ